MYPFPFETVIIWQTEFHSPNNMHFHKYCIHSPRRGRHIFNKPTSSTLFIVPMAVLMLKVDCIQWQWRACRLLLKSPSLATYLMQRARTQLPFKGVLHFNLEREKNESRLLFFSREMEIFSERKTIIMKTALQKCMKKTVGLARHRP